MALRPVILFPWFTPLLCFASPSRHFHPSRHLIATAVQFGFTGLNSIKFYYATSDPSASCKAWTHRYHHYHRVTSSPCGPGCAEAPGRIISEALPRSFTSRPGAFHRSPVDHRSPFSPLLELRASFTPVIFCPGCPGITRRIGAIRHLSEVLRLGCVSALSHYHRLFTRRIATANVYHEELRPLPVRHQHSCCGVPCF